MDARNYHGSSSLQGGSGPTAVQNRAYVAFRRASIASLPGQSGAVLFDSSTPRTRVKDFRYDFRKEAMQTDASAEEAVKDGRRINDEEEEPRSSIAEIDAEVARDLEEVIEEEDGEDQVTDTG